MLAKTTPKGVAAKVGEWDPGECVSGPSKPGVWMGWWGTLQKGVDDMERNNRALLAVFGVFVLALLFGPVLMGAWMGAGVLGPSMMGWGFGGGVATVDAGWPWGLRMLAGGLIMLAFWGALIVGVVL